MDKALGLDKYERLTEAVAIKLVETAGQVSYAKSSMNVTNGELSKNRCINPIYMSGYGKGTDEFWLEVTDKIYNLYDPKDIKRIYIHGDGANWIKEGINWLPESKLVLDKFHLNKAILKATARQPEKRRVYIGP